jgi:DNA-binding winged helix-turn-helix (wHTH) protein
MRLRFGDCVFDGEARKLTRSGQAVALSPRAFQLLQVLLERRPRVVSRRDLYDLLWPKTFVSDTSLPRVVTELRKALGDTRGTAHLIRTVHGFGYAFAGQAIDADGHTSSSCSLAVGGQMHRLLEGENVLGRGRECSVRVDASQVSRRHARILVAGAEGTIEDLSSKNGTYVNGRRLTGPLRLARGDQISLGSAVLTFVAESDPGSTETGHSAPSS